MQGVVEGYQVKLGRWNLKKKKKKNKENNVNMR